MTDTGQKTAVAEAVRLDTPEATRIALQDRDRDGKVGRGTILVEGSTSLPEPLRLEWDATAGGWARVADRPDSRQLDKQLTAAGWLFFFMAGAVKTTVFGFDEPGMIQKALKRLAAAAKLQRCNCLEIDDVAAHSFLGMPYVNVSAHLRRIQKGMIFSSR